MAAKPWYLFQEEIRDHFQTLGFIAETNKIINGVRTDHAIDVYVETKFMGQRLNWIVEAKKWTTKVNKLQVLGLRTIVDEIGADKGFILSEKGFQSGAIQAALKTNISLMTFDELKLQTTEFAQENVLKQYDLKIELIRQRYFAHPKSLKRRYGLTNYLGELNYSVPFVLTIAEWALELAREHHYPIPLNTLQTENYGGLKAENFQQLINWFNINFNIIDQKIIDAEIQMQKDGVFNPTFLDREKLKKLKV